LNSEFSVFVYIFSSFTSSLFRWSTAGPLRFFGVSALLRQNLLEKFCVGLGPNVAVIFRVSCLASLQLEVAAGVVPVDAACHQRPALVQCVDKRGRDRALLVLAQGGRLFLFTVVIASASRTEDPEFESPPGCKTQGLYVLQCCCQNLIRIVIVCMCLRKNKCLKTKKSLFSVLHTYVFCSKSNMSNAKLTM
jgi:hypothetical protein